MRFNGWLRISLWAGAGCLVGLPVFAQTKSTTPSNMVRVKLPFGIAISLPVGWVIQDAASNRRRTEHGVAVLDLAGIPTGQASTLLTASPDGDPDRTSVVVSLVRRPSASQSEVAALSGARLQQVNEQFKEDLLAGMRVEGAEMIRWSGASKVRLGDLYSLVSHYTYRMPSLGDRTMESHRIFLGGGSIGFMLQAPAKEMDSHQADFAAIKASFHASALP